MVFSLLFKPKRRKAVLALMREAKARGMTVEEYAKTLSPEELAKFLPAEKKPDDQPEIKMPDVTTFGLPPDGDVTSKAVIDDASVLAAVAAAREGNWVASADLLADLGTDWDRRASAVHHLADAAADDDTWLKAWRTDRPGDPDAAVVHAQGLVHLAWQIRSSYTPEHVSQEQWAGFFRVLEEAEEATQTAIDLAPADPSPWRTKLVVARGRQYPNDEYRRLWAELVARDPVHRNGHDQSLQYWCKKWFGSDELMHDFADEAAAKHPKLSVLPLVAALEADDSAAWADKRVGDALDQLLPWLDGEGRDHPNAVSDRAYAAYALVEQGRNEEAVEQFRLLGTRADGHVWARLGGPVKMFLKTRYLACYRAGRA